MKWVNVRGCLKNPFITPAWMCTGSTLFNEVSIPFTQSHIAIKTPVLVKTFFVTKTIYIKKSRPTVGLCRGLRYAFRER